MQDTSQNNIHQLNVVTNDPNYAFGPPSGDSAIIDFSVDFLSSNDNGSLTISDENVIIRQSGLEQSGSGTQTFFFVRFNGLGEPTDEMGDNICLAGCVIDFIGQAQARVCIEPLGYIHEGDCG